MNAIMNVQCPSCETSFPVDPLKVPAGGVRTQCTLCDTLFRVDPPEVEAAEPAYVPEVESRPEAEPEPLVGGSEVAGAMDVDLSAGVAESVDTDVDTDADDGADARDDWADLDFEPWSGGGPEEGGAEAGTADVGEVASAVDAGDEPEPDRDAVPSSGADTASADDDWGSSLGDDWILETTEDTVLGEFRMEDEDEDGGEGEGGIAAGETEVERLETVEEELRRARTDEAFGVPEPEFEMPAEPEFEMPAEPTPFQFGRRDPDEKARRLARVLVSDMVTYNPERHARALELGTIREDFEEEIEKSWAEYVEQVGRELADSTPYWKDALNEILAQGDPLF
ncbi:MAG: zinc-ribbon domain-containing protein [Longimicrobiales bacterium]|nr:zinc-ribbon domain-containing protein [Longimicrobiales bacterium]